METALEGAHSQPSDLLRDSPPEELLERFRAKWLRRLSRRELRGELVAAAFFVVGATALGLLAPWRPHLSLPLGFALVVTYALASRVKFEAGPCHTDASQLAVVPMMLLVPAPCIPLLVVAGSIATGLPAVIARRRHPERLLVSLGNSAYALGPAVVLAVAGGIHGLHDTPILLVALAAQFAVDSAVNVPREWFELDASPRAQLPGMAWTYGVDSLLAGVGLLAALASRTDHYAFVLLLPLLALLMIFTREREGRFDRALELSDAYRGTTMVLTDIVEADDEYTGLHSRTVVSLALAVGEELGLGARRRRDLEFAALLHDVGKIGVPKEIVNKPGPLNQKEWEIMWAHTVDGQRMLERVGGVLGGVGRIVRSSHERWAGSGYPDGMLADAIPVESRIIAACDAFNAMTTERPYRPGMSKSEAIHELYSGSGRQFDPRVVDALVSVLDANPDLAQARTALESAS